MINKTESINLYNDLSVLLGKYNISPHSIEEHDILLKEIYVLIKERDLELSKH